MDAKTFARALAAGRAVFGLTLLLAPELAIRGWVGRRSAREEGVQMLTRAVGARDLGLGLGALAAVARGDASARAWVAAGALADAGDFAATLAASRLSPAARVVALSVAGSSAVAGAACASSRM